MAKVKKDPKQVRLALRELLSTYARAKKLNPLASNKRDKTSRDAPSFVKKDKAPRPKPDLIWMKGRNVCWEFYLLQSPYRLRQLHPALSNVHNAIVCADASSNIGIVDPLRMLNFMAEKTGSTEKTEMRSITEAMPPFSIPPPDFHFSGLISKNHQFVKDHFSLRIRTGLGPKPIPGQFLQLMCDPSPHYQDPSYRCHSYSERRRPRLRGTELLSRRPFLRRPFSVASYGPPMKTSMSASDDEWTHLISWLEPEFEIIYRRHVDGAGTTALANHAAGDRIDVIGPLGKGFTMAPMPETAILVGGGIGAPPLLYLAEEMARRRIEARIFLGSLSRSKIPFQIRGGTHPRIPRFERLGLRPTLCTDDGSAGYHGLVTEALAEYLERERDKAGTSKIFACGPRSMLAALNGIATHYDIACEILLEETMACGFGACISCVCAVKEVGQKMRFTRICSEGPAFDSKMVMWHA